ncbi:MAG: orotidine 5'-phosphate decarboxylase / HUMPS family protein [Patescibacteria group bacterium]
MAAGTDNFSTIEKILDNIFPLVIFIFIILRVIAAKKKKQDSGQPPPEGSIPSISWKDVVNMVQGNPTRGKPAPTTLGVPPPPTPGTATHAANPAMLQPILQQMLAGTTQALSIGPKPKRLERKKRYLQVALNSTLDEARSIIRQLPSSERIIVEAGTPLIKTYGAAGIRAIRSAVRSSTYVVADLKTADLAEREVASAARAGAQGAVCLGVAPIETINRFIISCRDHWMDSMVDMMNVPSAIEVLKKLRHMPDVVILHRGVDESEFSKEKQIPWYQIQQIKGAYNILVAVAGGDSIREVQRAIFNSADIVVVWKDFYRTSAATGRLAQDFLKVIK